MTLHVIFFLKGVFLSMGRPLSPIALPRRVPPGKHEGVWGVDRTDGKVGRQGCGGNMNNYFKGPPILAPEMLGSSYISHTVK